MATSRTHESRLSSLEAGYDNLRGEIHGLRTDLRGFMGEVRSEMGRSSRTQWSPIIAGVAVVIGILGAFAAGPLNQLGRVDDRVHAIEANRFTRRDGDDLANHIERLWNRVDDLDDNCPSQGDWEWVKNEVLDLIRRSD